MLEKLKRYILDSSCHCVLGVDSADYDRIRECTLAVLYADGPEIRNHGEVLPYLALKTVLCKFLTEDRIRFSYSFKSVTGYRTEAAHTESWTGERLTVYHVVGKTESFSDNSYLVLEEQLYGFNKLKIDILGKTADIVMSLYAVAFENIGIYSALCKKLYSVLLAGFLLKHADKLCTDDLSLALGLGNSGKLVQKTFYCVNINKVCLHLIAEYRNYLLRLTLAQKSVVDVNAHKLLSDSLNEKGCNNGAVNASGECEQ